jgi:cellulose synthase/poly-beta-1,6-N-acetylglucosamine synthase-like glycosyltransferase
MLRYEGVNPSAIQVSTIIPTFRRPRELEETLRSVLAQDGVGLEIWVVDDSPEGSAREVVERVAMPHVHYLTMPVPSGGRPGAVRNHALPHARGTYVHFLDDDDLVPHGHYRRAVAAMDLRPTVGALFGRVAPFGTDEGKLDHEHAFFTQADRRARFCQRLGVHWAFAAVQSFLSTMLVCSAGLLRRECVEAVNGFDPEVRLVEDVDLYARMFQRFEVFFLDEVTIHYRIGDSLMQSRPDNDAIVQSYRRMHGRYKSELGAFRFLLLKAMARMFFGLL